MPNVTINVLQRLTNEIQFTYSESTELYWYTNMLMNMYKHKNTNKK